MFPVVRSDGLAVGLPRPDAAVRSSDHGLVLVAGYPAGMCAVRQTDLGHGGSAVWQVPGLPVRVQEDEPLAEGLGLDDTHARVLLVAFGLGFSGVASIPGPGLPVRIHDESLAAGSDGGDGLRLPGQAGCGLLCEFRVQILTVGIPGLIGVDSSLSVHGKQPIIVRADAGELGVLTGVEDAGRRLLAGPCVDVLVGSERGLPSAAGCGLQVAEPVGSLGGGGNQFGCAVLRPGVDAPVACHTDKLISCGLDTDVVRLLQAGRADGQLGAGDGPVVRAQRPARDLGPLGFQGHVLEDGGLKVKRLAIMCPPVEQEAFTHRVLLRGSGEDAGFHG